MNGLPMLLLLPVHPDPDHSPGSLCREVKARLRYHKWTAGALLAN